MRSNGSAASTRGYDLTMASDANLTICADPATLAETAAHLIVDAATEAVRERGRFLLCLAGGETPRETYRCLALPAFSERMRWDQTWIFFGDERAVPPDHPDSNYRMANAALLSKVPVPSAQVARIRGEAEDSEVAAADYTRVIAEAFGSRRGELPSFDLILLGMGVDGHTASLFPGSPVLKEVFRPVAAVHAAAAAIPERLTFTFPLINAAARVMFLVAGSEKAKVVKAVMTDSGSSLPASMVRPTNGRLTWLLDRPAAALLGPGKRR
jgi:6-phosphogluconolactonase